MKLQRNKFKSSSLYDCLNRPLSELATSKEFEGDTEALDTGAYSNVREDSSLGATYKLPEEVEFRKRSNKEAV